MNGVPIHLTFTRASNQFCTMGKSGWLTNNTWPILKIVDMSIFVRKVKLYPSMMNKIENDLNISNAIYPIQRPVIKVVNLTKGQATFNLDNIFTGQLPNKIIMGMVRQEAYVGNHLKNPLRFEPFGVNYLSLNINGEMLPTVPYQPDFSDNIKEYRREYHDFMMNVGV